MNKVAAFLFTLFMCFIIPSISLARPVDHGYYYPPAPKPVPVGYVYRCHTELFPIIHEYCEYVRMYSPVVHHKPTHLPPPPLPRHYRPAPPKHSNHNQMNHKHGRAPHR